MTRILTDVGALVTALIPAWALPFVIGGIGVLLLPAWLESVRSKQIKGAIRRMIRADDTVRPELATRALQLAGHRRLRLIGLVQEAIRYGQHSLIEAGLARLEAHPKGRTDAEKLRERIEAPKSRFRDPVEAVVRVARLLEQDLRVAAEEQLEAALLQFPHDDELRELCRRLHGVAC